MAAPKKTINNCKIVPFEEKIGFIKRLRYKVVTPYNTVLTDRNGNSSFTLKEAEEVCKQHTEFLAPSTQNNNYKKSTIYEGTSLLIFLNNLVSNPQNLPIPLALGEKTKDSAPKLVALIYYDTAQHLYYFYTGGVKLAKNNQNGYCYLSSEQLHHGFKLYPQETFPNYYPVNRLQELRFGMQKNQFPFKR